MNFLTITGPHLKDGTPEGNCKAFVAQVNPSSVKINHQINYTDEGAGTGASIIPAKKFSGAKSQQVSFELLLDATGVLPGVSNTMFDIIAQVELFKKTCYYYVGAEHETPYVAITWNGMSLFRYEKHSFLGRIANFDINYTLFSPIGAPLRAKINASFVGTMPPEEEAKIKDNMSPDLTHVITVRHGDSLPVLCKKVYGDEKMYHEIARVNQLLSFRNLEPGMELVFPPIK